ncbi:ABC transporter permease [Desulfitobacterium sp.]|uniref:ABC transporter permease n=1 Tax=Desulfitobacterium sp. TaxID=49981 RepID=UPI002BB01E1C|nr:ABC transporter permease [Desulfitobacterium sp.]HVJ48508.1 ABC transporter permease [Desulfitobacterium sp.]
MAVFQIALVNELEKLYKKKKALAAVILSLAVIILGQLGVLGVRTGFGIRGAGNIAFPMLVLSVVVNTILPLFTALVTIDSFSGEFAQNTMRITLTRPASRFKIFMAKITAITLFILTILVLLLILSLIAGFLFNVSSATASDVLKTVLAYAVSILPQFILALGIVLIANLFKSGVSVFFISILGFLGFKVLGLVFSQYASLLPTTQLDWYTLWISNTFPLLKILRQFLLMVGYAIMLLTAGFYFFDKKEF